MGSIEGAVRAWATAMVVLDAVVVIEAGLSVSEFGGVLGGVSHRRPGDSLWRVVLEHA